MQLLGEDNRSQNALIPITGEARKEFENTLPIATDNILENSDFAPSSYDQLYEILETGFQDNMLNASIYNMMGEKDYDANITILIKNPRTEITICKTKKGLQEAIASPITTIEDNCLLWSEIKSMKKFGEWLIEKGLKKIERDENRFS